MFLEAEVRVVRLPEGIQRLPEEGSLCGDSLFGQVTLQGEIQEPAYATVEDVMQAFDASHLVLLRRECFECCP